MVFKLLLLLSTKQAFILSTKVYKISHNLNFSLDSSEFTPWTNLTEAEDNVKFYLMVYGGLVGANSFIAFIRAFSYAYGGIVAAKVMHNRLLNNIMKVGLLVTGE